MGWSSRPEPKFRLAVGSCVKQEDNRIQVVELSDETGLFEVTAECAHSFPPTKVMWAPDGGLSAGSRKSDLLASTGTSLQIWQLSGGELKPSVNLANTRTQGQSGQAAPLTSFDWSSVCPQKLGTSSVDTTCTIWNLERQKIETQLIAHDKAVYDITFSSVDHLFASVGADGSVRLFDQRNLDHSTIIYEASPPTPLLRLAWNKINTNHIATIAMDQPGVVILDIRRPSVAYAAFAYHEACVNHMTWAPQSRNHLLVGTDDGYALIWDVKEMPTKADGQPDTAVKKSNAPLLSYDCDYEIYQVQWPTHQPDHVAFGTAKQIQVLQV